ncbi:heparinase II/III family protein [Actinophytocola sediminis]
MTSWVENPPHVDDATMRHITDQHLLDSLDRTAPGLEPVAGDLDTALRAWRAYRASESAPVPVADLRRWVRRRAARPAVPPADLVLRHPESVRHILGTRAGHGGFREAADTMLHTEFDLLDASRGRSSFYGFHYLYWLKPLLEAYAFTGRAEYAARYGELFSQWYDVRDQVVGDWPGLDVIWYSLGVWARSAMFNQAISLLSGEPAFTDEQWRRTMKCLLGGARWAAEEHATFRHGNWQVASVSELAHTAAMFPEFAEHLTWRDVAQRRIEDHLELDFYADGGHFERAPSYHTMCLQALHVAVLSADHDQWPILAHPRLRAAHDWLANMAHPAGWVPHLQDSHVVRPAEMLLVGHHLWGDPTWKHLVERWMAADEIVDRLDRLGPRPDGGDPVEHFRAAPSVAPAGRSALLPTSGHAMLRQGWASTDLTTVVNLGPYVGHELEPHSHHASLDFVISGWGVPLAWEAGGPPSYDDPGYYSWFQAGRGHNSVTLAGEPDSVGRDSVVESFWALGDDHRGVDVAAGRHDAFATRHRRRIVFVRSAPSYWLIVDDLGDDQGGDLGGVPVEATWTLHGLAPWRVAGDRRFVAESGPGLVVVPATVPAGVELTSDPARLPRCQVPLPGQDDEDALRARRATPDEYGTIHGLHLAHERGVLHTVLVPFADQAPEVTAELAGETVTVGLAGVRDTVGRHGWTRDHGDGVLERARWDLDAPVTEDTEDTVPAIAGRGVRAWWCRLDADGLVAEVDTDRAAVVTVHAPWPGSMTVNGVGVSPTGNRVRLPSAGRWTIRVTAHD